MVGRMGCTAGGRRRRTVKVSNRGGQTEVNYVKRIKRKGGKEESGKRYDYRTVVTTERR